MTEIIHNMPEADYHAISACSNSVLSTIATKSPAHIFAPRPATPAQEVGRIIHMAVLEPHRFDAQVAVMPDVDRRTKEGKALYAEYVSANEGKTLVSASDHETYKLMQSQVWVDDTARKLLEKGDAEVSVFWEQDGLQCKARFDFISALGVAVDLKTTQSSKPESFAYDAYKYGYHRQIAWYMRGAKAVGLDLANMFLIAVEKTAPFPVSIFDLDAESYEVANMELDKLFAIYRKCKAENYWPAYEVDGKNVHTLRLPYKAFTYNPLLDTEVSQ